VPTSNDLELCFEQVYQPVFFDKLASRGLVPNTEAEAAQLLEIGAAAYREHVEILAKQASANTSLISAAHSYFLGGSAQVDTNSRYKQAASAYAADPAIRAAALAIAVE
jgi:hypothetical protein